MSFTMHGTDEVFAALLGLRSNSYRMYDPSEHRSYYDHDCETYERAVNDAAREYERLLKHCEKQRDELAGLKDPERKERIDRMKRVLSREEGQAMEEQAGTEQNVARITDELRQLAKDPLLGYASQKQHIESILAIADRIDERHERDMRDEYKRGHETVLDIDMDELEHRFTSIIRLCISNVLMHNIKAYGQGGYLTSDDVNKQPEEYIGEYVCRLLSSVECCTRPEEDSWESIIQDAVKLGYADYPTTGYEAELVQRCKRLAGE